MTQKFRSLCLRKFSSTKKTPKRLILHEFLSPKLGIWVCGSAVLFRKLLSGLSRYQNKLFLNSGPSLLKLATLSQIHLIKKGKKCHFSFLETFKQLQVPSSEISTQVMTIATQSPVNSVLTVSLLLSPAYSCIYIIQMQGKQPLHWIIMHFTIAFHPETYCCPADDCHHKSRNLKEKAAVFILQNENLQVDKTMYLYK